MITIEDIAKEIDPEAWESIQNGKDQLPGSFWGIRRSLAKIKAERVIKFLQEPPDDLVTEISLQLKLKPDTCRRVLKLTMEKIKNG